MAYISVHSLKVHIDSSDFRDAVRDRALFVNGVWLHADFAFKNLISRLLFGDVVHLPHMPSEVDNEAEANRALPPLPLLLRVLRPGGCHFVMSFDSVTQGEAIF